MNLFSRFEGLNQASASPFIWFADGGMISYAQASEASARYANALVGLGVRPGDRVAVQVEKSAQALYLYLACLRAGAVFLPLNTAYTLAELAYFLGDAEPRLVVCGPASAEGLRGIIAAQGTVVNHTLDHDGRGSLANIADRQPGSFANVARDGGDLAAILYTSGTTGRAKGAMLSHDNLASNAAILRTIWEFGSTDVLLHALPIFHTHGLFVAVNVTLMAGSSLILLPGFDAEALVRLMPRATCLMGVPTFYSRMLKLQSLNRTVVRNMRLFISGSAPLAPEIHAAWQERTGFAILERYGMTETNMNASNPYRGHRQAGSVGLPLPGVEIRIADERGDVRPVGETGMIQVRGPNVFGGYWKMPERSAQEFTRDNFFITGDIGKIDRDGYLSIVGRAKDLIISGGFNVYPKEIEDEVNGLSGVADSAVIGVPHPDFGEGVIAIVVPKDGSSIDEATILGALQRSLAKYKLPKRIFFADALPRNVMGKVQKNALRDAHVGVFSP
jgi:malonyl-CoA/methylmalonyl-CoA synthetase